MFSERVQYGRAGRRDQTRERVVECAQRLFADRGFAATTVRQIAAEAGVSVGTVMGVGDKDALLLAAFDGWIGAVHRARDGLEPVAAGADPVTRIGDAVAPFLDLFDADTPLAREYGAVLARGGATTEVFGELAVALHDDFAAVFADAGLGDDTPRAARAVYLAYLGLVMTSAITGSDAASIRDELESVAAVILRSPRKDS